MSGGEKRLLFGAIAVVLVAAAVVVVLIVRSTSDTPVARGPEPLNGREVCADHVLVYFKTDEQMQAAAPGMAADSQVLKVYTETKQQAWQHFQKIFANQPELLKLSRPEALPASLSVRPADGVDLYAMRDRFRTQIPQADKVDALGPRETAEMAAKFPSTGRPDPCPASGER